MPADQGPPRRRLLAIFAHPDDESCGPGGTLARYAAEGVQVTVATVTRGEWGGYGELRDLPPWQMAALRASELFAACRALGASRCILLGHEDGSLKDIPRQDLERELAELILELNPHVIITHSDEGSSGHPDHNVLSSATLGAAQEALRGFGKPPSGYTAQPPDMYRLFGAVLAYCGPMPQRGDPSLVEVDVSRYLRKKLEACKRHVSQEYCWRPQFEGNYLRRLGREVFRLVWSREPQSAPLRGDLFAGLGAA